MGMKKSKKTGIQDTKAKDKAVWTDENTEVLLEIWAEQIEAGNRPNGQFNNTAKEFIEKEFPLRSRFNYDWEQIRNRWDTLKRDWTVWEQLKKEIGPRYDDVKNVIIAEDEWWDRKIAERSAYKKYRKGGPVSVKLQERCFVGCTSTGATAYNPDKGPLLHGGAITEEHNESDEFSTQEMAFDVTVPESQDLLHQTEEFHIRTPEGEDPRVLRVPLSAPSVVSTVPQPSAAGPGVPRTSTITPSPDGTQTVPAFSGQPQTRKRIRSYNRSALSLYKRYNSNIERVIARFDSDSATNVACSEKIEKAMSVTEAIEAFKSLPWMSVDSEYFPWGVVLLEDRVKRIAFASIMGLGQNVVERWIDAQRYWIDAHRRS